MTAERRHRLTGALLPALAVAAVLLVLLLLGSLVELYLATLPKPSFEAPVH